eukprot:10947587-Heterocapsa_arctica.AAC.1
MRAIIGVSFFNLGFKTTSDPAAKKGNALGYASSADGLVYASRCGRAVRPSTLPCAERRCARVRLLVR